MITERQAVLLRASMGELAEQIAGECGNSRFTMAAEILRASRPPRRPAIDDGPMVKAARSAIESGLARNPAEAIAHVSAFSNGASLEATKRRSGGCNVN